MKTYQLIIPILAASALGLSSCNNLADYYSAPALAAGTIGEAIPGTVVSERSIMLDASSTSKNLGTLAGAAVGAGAGSLLGGGSGNVVSTVGFGVVGAAAGRAIGKYADQTPGQVLSVKSDKTGRTFNVTQPIYRQFGAIPVGTHGTLTVSNNNSVFAPDGY
ncbi:MAG: hypothetical protein R3Y56_03900 [Akkermansia sp.]